MSTSFSVAEILAKLEAQIEHHRQQAAMHAEQEAHHREQNAFHLAELEKVSQHFAAFKNAALPAAELVRASAPPKPAEPEDDLREFAGKRIMVSKLVARTVDRLQDETFAATRVAAELNRRYRDKLRKPVDGRVVSVTLRRLLSAGQLRLVRPGTANRQAVYGKPVRVQP